MESLWLYSCKLDEKDQFLKKVKVLFFVIAKSIQYAIKPTQGHTNNSLLNVY